MKLSWIIRCAAIAGLVYAAIPPADSDKRPIGVLLEVPGNATVTTLKKDLAPRNAVTLGGEREAKLAAVAGQLIETGARLTTGGGRVRIVLLPDVYTYEYSPFPP